MTQIFGNTEVDSFQLGDPSGINGCDGADLRPGCETVASPGYVFLGSKTRIYGSASPPPAFGPSPGDADPSLADGEDTFTVFYLQGMDVVSRTVAAPGSDDAGTDPGAGHTLTLDGQADTDYYTIHTLGSHGDDAQLRHQRARHGRARRRRRRARDLRLRPARRARRLHPGHADAQARPTTSSCCARPSASTRRRRTGSPTTPTASRPTCDASPTEKAHHPAFVALLHGSDGPSTATAGSPATAAATSATSSATTSSASTTTRRSTDA